MKSVFLVKTPLQLLNAIEAKYYFNLNAGDCILIVMGDRKSKPQLINLANATNEWGNTIILNDVCLFYGDPFEKSIDSFFRRVQSLNIFKRSFFNVRRLNRISRQLVEVKYIFVGYARYIYMKHFINIMPHEKAFHLDDGNATIILANERKQGNILNPPMGIKKKLKLYGKRYFQGVNDKDKKTLNFFTMYDIFPSEKDEVFKNKFEYLRSNMDNLSKSGDIYFIGSSISEAGILTQKNELIYINKVKNYFSGAKFVYIAHRRDSLEKLELIRNDLNIEVVLFDYPIEYQLAYVGPRPMVLASFISSALDSCRIIFDDKLKIISFKMDLRDSPMREEIEPIYESYECLKNDNFIVESNF